MYITFAIFVKTPLDGVFSISKRDNLASLDPVSSSIPCLGKLLYLMCLKNRH